MAHGAETLADAQATTDDRFLGGALSILQPKRGYRAGLDALLLAASIDAGRRVLDVGAGVGVVGLAVARRLPGAEVVLVEREPGLTVLARANCARNGLAGRVHVIEADIARPLGELALLQPLVHSFDHVLANPPYHTRGQCTAGRSTGGAHAMGDGDLERWVRFMAAMAAPGGMLSLVHRPEALDAIIAATRGRFGGHVIRPLHARAGASASRVLVHAVKGSRAPLTLAAGLVLHEADGRFRPEIDAALRAGAALPTCQ
jgi:tRNA1(Val) A37 N6-methylase TrmN6